MNGKLKCFAGKAIQTSLIAFLMLGYPVVTSAAFAENDQFNGQPSLVIQTGHTNGIGALAASQDGRFVASAGMDQSINIWDAKTGLLLHSLSGHDGSIESVAFSPDSKSLVSGSYDKTVKLWDLQSGKLVRSTPVEMKVHSVAFSSDGKLVAAGGSSGIINVWSVDDGALKHSLTARHLVWSLAFSVDCKFLAASGGKGDAILLFDLSDDQNQRTLEGHTKDILSLAFSPDGKYLASGSQDRTIKIWDVTTDTLVRSLDNQVYEVRALQFSPGSKTLASGTGCYYDIPKSRTENIKLWDVETGQMQCVLRGHTDSISALAFAPDGKTLFSGSTDRSIRQWDIANCKQIKSFDSPLDEIYAVSFNAGGNQLAVGAGQMVQIWDLSAAKLVRELSGHTSAIASLAYSREGRYLASGDYEGHIVIWDAVSGASLKTYYDREQEHIDSLAFSPNSKLLLAVDQEKVMVIDVVSGNLIRTIDTSITGLNKIAYTPDGKYFAAGLWSQGIRLWDAGSYSQHLSIPVKDVVVSISIAADGKTIACGDRQSKVTVFDLSTGRQLQQLSNQAGDINAVAFSPDGKILASGSGDKTISFWNTQSGAAEKSLKGHTFWIQGLAYNPDGKLLASASSDGTVRLWNTATGAELVKLYWFGKDAWVVVTPDCRYDGSPKGLSYLHYVLDNQVSQINTQTDKHFCPSLLEKVIKNR